jgi:formate hydrogenlyase transcriptional activator
MGDAERDCQACAGRQYLALLAASEAIVAHRELPALFRDLAGRLRPLVRFDRLVVALHDVANTTLRMHVLDYLDRDLPPVATDTPAAQATGAVVRQTELSLPGANAADQSRGPEWSAAVRPCGIQSTCELPLTIEGRRLGTLVFASKDPAAYAESEACFLQHVANQVAVAVENVSAFGELAAVREQLAGRGQQYLALLAASEAIASHRDLPALFHGLAQRLLPVVHFDYLSLVLHEAATNVMRLHVLEAREHESSKFEMVLNPEADPAGLVWQTQQPLITSNVSELSRWPRLLARVEPYGVQSYCWLPLTTARRRLGALVFTSKQRAAYNAADLGFLQQVANQVAVAVENALAYQEIEALKDRLAKEKAYLEEEVRTEHNFGDIVGDSPALRAVLRKVQTVAPTDSTVLVWGETGTGKELIARAVHDLSPRKGRTLVKLNCSAIPTGLLESELFGHEKGAFTGAIAQKTGRFELAHQGTLFLDEVGDIPLELQSKLLRVLQEQEFERLGGTRTIRVNVRLVAATNRDLAQMVAEGRFRSDLYYRLNVFPIVLPPLRERPEDIPRLVQHFTQRFARRMGRRIESIPTAVMEALVRYHWPGNVRELQNVIERAVILSPGSTLQVPLNDLAPLSAPAQAPAVTLAEVEREQILAALEQTGWRVGGSKGAAARLGMKRTTLQKTMKRLGVSRPG